MEKAQINAVPGKIITCVTIGTLTKQVSIPDWNNSPHLLKARLL